MTVMQELDNATRELRLIARQIERLEKEAEALRDKIKQCMGGAESITTISGNRVTWQTVTTRRIDTAALKQALPEVANRFTKQITTRRFSIA